MNIVKTLTQGVGTTKGLYGKTMKASWGLHVPLNFTFSPLLTFFLKAPLILEISVVLSQVNSKTIHCSLIINDVVPLFLKTPGSPLTLPRVLKPIP